MNIKTKTIEKTIYVCSVCGYENEIDWRITDCENNHRIKACKHEKAFYCLIEDGETGDCSYSRIALKCPTCWRSPWDYLKKWDLSDIREDAPSDLLKKIVELIEEAKA